MNKVHAEEFIPELRAATADTFLQPLLFDRLRNVAGSEQTGCALALAEVLVKMNKVQAEGFFPEHRAATADTSAVVRRGFLELIEHHAGNMETQCTANSHLLARGGSPGYPGHGHLAPGWSFSFCAWLPGCRLPCAWPCVSLTRRGLRLPPSLLLVASPALRTRRGRPWRFTTLVPQGLGSGVSPLTAPAVLSSPQLSLWLAAHFLPLFWCPVPPCLVAMSCVSLQLSSRRWPRLRTPSCSASPGSWAPLALVGLQPPPPLARLQPPQPPQRPRRRPRPATRLQALLRAAATTSASSRARSRSRSPAPLPKRAPRRSSSTASGLRGSVALAESGLVTGLAIKSCPPVPPAQLRLSRVSRALRAASVAPPPPGDAPVPSARSAPASEAPRAAEAASDSDDDWDALLDAHGLALPPGGAAAAVAQPADAAGASRRARDKRRRRLRKAAKRSMWREI